MATDEKTPLSPVPSQNHTQPSQPLDNQKLEDARKDLRQRKYKVTEEYDTTGFVKVSGEPTRKTKWDWFQLFLQIITAFALPIALYIGTQYYSSQQTLANQAAALDQQQEVALQSYLDHMSDLLLGNNTGKNSLSLASAQPNDGISQVARARTLTVLRRLDGNRKSIVLQFLYDARLIGSPNTAQSKPVFFLAGANLEDIELLPGTELAGADLSGAKLAGAKLAGAHLSLAKLGGAHLRNADLGESDLRGADLTYTDLRGANLYSARITQEQVNQAITCKDTITLTGITHSQDSCSKPI